jgi:lipoprotein-releasing system permease protein
MALKTIVPTLAKRFLLSKSSDGFLSFISWVSVVGVALGVMALTVVTSVINGFEGELIRVITNMNGDVLLYSRGEPLRDPDVVETEIRKVLPQTQAVTASFVTEIMASGPQGVSGAILQGVDTERLGLVTAIPQHVIAGRMPVVDEEIVLGAAVADKLGATVGTEIRLIAPFTGGPEATPRVEKAHVVGIVRMGMHDYDSKFIFMTLESVQKFLDQPGRVTNFNIKLGPGVDSRAASDRLARSFEFPFRAKDWSQLNKNLFYAIKLEKAVIAIILTVIVIVAAFNVVSTLMMMIHDKTKEIAILKAMGFRKSQSFGLFCLIGVGIGSVGACLGIGLGLGLSMVLEKTQLIKLSSDIYYIGFLPVMVHWKEIVLIGGMALLISFVATIYPSWSVSRRSALEGLRYD